MQNSRVLAPALGIAAIVFAPLARADGPPGAQGSKLSTSGYSLDLFQGPVLAGSRITGLAGAYAPIAEGAEGLLFHPASPAVRPPWSTHRFDWDLDVSLTFPSAVVDTDFDNNGTVGSSQKNFYFLTLGGNLQYGPFGLGVTTTIQSYRLEDSLVPGTPNLELALVAPKMLSAWSFLDDQLQVGAGVRWVDLTLRVPGGADLLTISGAGFEAGAIFAPKSYSFRASVAVRTPVSGSVAESSKIAPNAAGDLVVDGRYLPREVRLPAEVEFGFAWQFGPRPLNAGWIDDAAIPYEVVQAHRRGPDSYPGTYGEVAHAIAVNHSLRLPRKKLLVVGSLLLTARTEAGIGLEGLLQQKVDRSGRVWSASPRIGLEAEPWENYLQVRAGSYFEPTRFDYSSYRIHGTFGLDFKLLEWSVFGLFEPGTAWRIGGELDASRQYFGSGFSFGVWH